MRTKLVVMRMVLPGLCHIRILLRPASQAHCCTEPCITHIRASEATQAGLHRRCYRESCARSCQPACPGDVAARAGCDAAGTRHVQVSDGRVKSVSAASAGDLVSDGWTLLDVRPPHEVQKVRLHIMTLTNMEPRLDIRNWICCNASSTRPPGAKTSEELLCIWRLIHVSTVDMC